MGDPYVGKRSTIRSLLTIPYDLHHSLDTDQFGLIEMLYGFLNARFFGSSHDLESSLRSLRDRHKDHASVLNTARLLSWILAIHGLKHPSSTAGSLAVTEPIGTPDPFTM